MNKNIVIGIVLVIFIVFGGLIIVNNQSNSKSSDAEQMVNEETSAKEDSRAGSINSEVDKKNGAGSIEGERYVEYSKTYLDQEVQSRRVLYFYASWCPTCRPADTDFKANKNKIPEDVVVFRVNYNDTDTDQEEKELAKKYAITYQHTFVQIDESGNEITRWNGGKTEELLANIK